VYPWADIHQKEYIRTLDEDSHRYSGNEELDIVRIQELELLDKVFW
jgi:hypothetical protein